MNQMKTLTVNGKTYEIYDATAPRIDNATAGGGLWSSKHTVDRLCPAFNEQGEVVACQPVEDYPLSAVSCIEPVQEGTGEPSPDNIRPITGHTALKLWRGGKNLLENINGSGSRNGIHYTVNEDGSIICTGTSTANNSFQNINAKGESVCAIPPGDYIVSGGKDGVGVQVIVDGKELVTCRNNELRFTVPKTAKNSWIRLSVPTAGTTVNTTVYPMVRPASVTDSNYEPYRGEEFSVQLGQTVYGGSYDWARGVLTLDKALLTLTGTENWSIQASTTDHFQVKAPVGNIFGKNGGICSHFRVVSVVDLTKLPQIRPSVSTQALWYEDALGSYANVEKFKAFLAQQHAAGTPVQVCYEMANPVTVQLTPREVFALSGTNALYSSAGDTAVSGRTDPAAVMEKLTHAIIALGGNV